MKEIPLTQDKVALVDDEDFKWLVQWKWCAVKDHDTYYAMRTEKHKGKQKSFRMHREILHMAPDDRRMVDHRNHNGLDNQKHNIRPVTNRQNQWNQKRNRRSRFPGVGWRSATQQWIVKPRVGGKYLFVRLFDDEEEAARVYCDAIRKYDPASAEFPPS